MTIARVVKTQGRHGELAAHLHTDFPERFGDRNVLFALQQDGSRRRLDLQSFWPHKGQVVLKFSDIDSIAEAESLIGCELQIPLSQRAELEGDTAYVSDLVGCKVWDCGHDIGNITDVRFGAGEAPLLVVKGAKEYEVPFARAFLEKVDVRHKEVRMRLPQGMLEVNAPLTEEEKKQQKSG